MRTRENALKVSILALVLLCLCACPWVSCRRTPTSHLRVGYIPFSADLPFFVAMEKGFFAEQGIRLKLIRFTVSSECLNAEIAGQIDAAMGNSLSALYAIEQKQPGALKIFLPMFETKENHVSHLLVRKDSSIGSVYDLKGKRIGTYTGSTQLLYLRLFLKSLDLDPDNDIQIVQIAPNLQVQALDAGQIDALFTIEPYTTMAVDQEIAEYLVRFARGKIMTPFPGGAFSFNAKTLKEQRATCSKLVSALEKASVFIQTHPAEAKRALAKYTPIDEGVAVKTGIYEWVPRGQLTPVLIKALQKEADLFAEHKLLDGRINVKHMLVLPQDID